MRQENKSRKPNQRKVLGLGAVLLAFVVAVAATPDFISDRTIDDDLAQIEKQENHVALHKEQWEVSKAEGDKTGAIIAKSDLCKAKADLKRSKAYLKADKKAFVRLEKAEMQPDASALKESRRELCSAKKQLKKDVRQGNTSAIVDDAELVVKKQKTVDRYEAKLTKQEADLDERVAAIDERMKGNGKVAKEEKVKADADQERLAWNATASVDKTYYEIENPETSAGTQSSAVLEP